MKKIFKFIKSIIFLILFTIIFFFGMVIYEGHNLYKETIAKESIVEYVEKLEKQENYLTYENIPKDFFDAIVAVEDHRFYSHPGFDVLSFARAFIRNFESKKVTSGGSTITMQVAKNMYFMGRRDIYRKVAEMYVANDLENLYEKDKILEIYANIIYFGDGYYGVKEAAEGYFKKDISKLNFDEITMLAGLPNAPSVYAPTKNYKLAKERQEQVKKAYEKYVKNK